MSEWSVSHHHEGSTMSVVFSKLDDVKTIYRFVRNLPTGVRVSNYIPPCLANKNKFLKNRAYHLRNGETPHRTVIGYQGNTLELFAKKVGAAEWQKVRTSFGESRPLFSSANLVAPPHLVLDKLYSVPGEANSEDYHSKNSQDLTRSLLQLSTPSSCSVK